MATLIAARVAGFDEAHPSKTIARIPLITPPRTIAPRRYGRLTHDTNVPNQQVEKQGGRMNAKHCAMVIGFAIVFAAPLSSEAYRPFDSTDAAVASTGEVELELGPIGFLRTSQRRFLIAPAAILNLGIVEDMELVLQGRHFILFRGPAEDAQFRLVDTGLFLKAVLREGCLQAREGPSLAVELGPLLPTVNDEPGIGATATMIVSQRSEAGTVHINGEATLTRAHNLDLFGGVIIEGPNDWVVRPVLEGFVDRDFGGVLVVSGLGGAIWRIAEELSLDLALRVAGADQSAVEVRAGLTWATPLWHAR
jgi:hypothetical protein